MNEVNRLEDDPPGAVKSFYARVRRTGGPLTQGFFIPEPEFSAFKHNQRNQKPESFQGRPRSDSIEEAYLFSGPPGGGQKHGAGRLGPAAQANRSPREFRKTFFAAPLRKKRREIQGGGGVGRKASYKRIGCREHEHACC